MAITYKYIDPPREPNDAVVVMRDTLMPLIQEYWDTKGKSVYGRDLQFNVLTFIQMWSMGSMVVVIAYEDDKPVGFLLGVRFVPLMYDSVAVQTEVCYGKRAEIEQGLFQYLTTIIHFMNINEVWVNSEALSDVTLEWPKHNTFTTTRYVKS